MGEFPMTSSELPTRFSLSSWFIKNKKSQPQSESKRNVGTTLSSVSFNQTFDCFSCSTDQGFRIYSLHPLQEDFRRDCKGGIRLVEMLFKSNIIAFVGGDQNPEYPPHRLIIWDDNQKKCIANLCQSSKIRAVKLRNDLFVVVLEHKIKVYGFTSFKVMYEIETVSNPKGLCDISHIRDSYVVACPGLHNGQVRVAHHHLKKTDQMIDAHESQISCFSLTRDGAILATASTRGTVVRIFNTLDGTLLQEVRRGSDQAEVYSISLSPIAQWLAVCSEKGTVHIFGLKEKVTEKVSSSLNTNFTNQLGSGSGSDQSLVASNKGQKPARPSLELLKGVLPKYFSSQWSFAQFHLPANVRYTIGFGANNTIVMAGLDG
ncbi:hypothetical protein KI387_025461, partial [Taxus chinensis]